MANFCVKCGSPPMGGPFCTKCGSDARSVAQSVPAQAGFVRTACTGSGSGNADGSAISQRIAQARNERCRQVRDRGAGHHLCRPRPALPPDTAILPRSKRTTHLQGVRATAAWNSRSTERKLVSAESNGDRATLEQTKELVPHTIVGRGRSSAKVGNGNSRAKGGMPTKESSNSSATI